MTLLVVSRPDPALDPSRELAVARAQVLAARPGTTEHEANRARILGFIDGHADALHRTCLEGHLTGSAAVLEPSTGRMLLLLHAKVRRWLQPGGHADGDANLAAVALREAEEETGIEGLRVVTPAVDLDVHVFQNAAGTEPDHLHLDVRHLVIAPEGSIPVGNHESTGIVWADVGDLARYEVDAGTVRLAKAARAVLAEIP